MVNHSSKSTLYTLDHFINYFNGETNSSLRRKDYSLLTYNYFQGAGLFINKDQLDSLNNYKLNYACNAIISYIASFFNPNKFARQEICTITELEKLWNTEGLGSFLERLLYGRFPNGVIFYFISAMLSMRVDEEIVGLFNDVEDWSHNKESNFRACSIIDEEFEKFFEYKITIDRILSLRPYKHDCHFIKGSASRFNNSNIVSLFESVTKVTADTEAFKVLTLRQYIFNMISNKGFYQLPPS